MPSNTTRLAETRFLAWARRHPWPTVSGLLLLAALLIGTGYRVSRDSQARSHLRAVRDALERREWSEAQEQAAECLRIWPDSSEAHLLAARSARRLELF